MVTLRLRLYRHKPVSLLFSLLLFYLRSSRSLLHRMPQRLVSKFSLRFQYVNVLLFMSSPRQI